MKILCVCTSGKDRSPIMAEYLRERGHDSYAVGINKYFTQKKRTKYIAATDLLYADLILVVSELHSAYIRGMLNVLSRRGNDSKRIIVIPIIDGRHKNMPRDEFVSWVRAAMDKKIKRIEG